MPVLAALLSLTVLTAQGDLSRHIYPLAPNRKSPTVVINADDFPEGRAWLETSQKLIEMWFPSVCSWLGTADYNPPEKITLVVKKEISAPAYTSGRTITVNGKWITQHPEDLGMMIHELVHVIQSYPDSRSKPGWLVEGIADYIRWWRYEPELHSTSGRTKIKPDAKYTDSYRTTGMWLAWCSRKYNMALVPALDEAMRKGEDPMPIFRKLTDKDPDELWKEFVENQK